MKLKYGRNFLFALVFLNTAFFLFNFIFKAPSQNPAPSGTANKPIQNDLTRTFQSIPLYFEPNVGQADEKSSFITRGYGYEMKLTNDKAILSLAKTKPGSEKTTASNPDLLISTLTMSLANSNKNPELSGEDETAGKVNYLV